MTVEEGKEKTAGAKEKPVKTVKVEDVTIDPASMAMIERSREMHIETIFDRAHTMKP